MNKGCNLCKQYDMGKLQFNGPDIPRKCLSGNTDSMNQWWEENGNKKDLKELTDMSCFQETELGNFLIKTNEILDNIKKLKEK